MATTVTVKGQITLPKQARDAAGIKAGDRVEVRATAAGTLVVEKPDTVDDYRARLYALAERKLIRGTTEEIMQMTRGDAAEDPPVKKK
jgi:antitoxin PrlF